MMKRKLLMLISGALLLTGGAFLALALDPTIIDEWTNVKAPPPPELKAVTTDPATTALLILDIQKNSCTLEARPRCVASVPRIKAMLALARSKGMMVALQPHFQRDPGRYLAGGGPAAGEPVVKSGVDKFFRTDLEQLLAARGIKTVIVTGTVAQGAVLNTATGAALRGLNVIIPVDGMSADILYGEQYTAWHLVNSPGTRARTTLTKFSLITLAVPAPSAPPSPSPAAVK